MNSFFRKREFTSGFLRKWCVENRILSKSVFAKFRPFFLQTARYENAKRGRRNLTTKSEIFLILIKIQIESRSKNLNSFLRKREFTSGFLRKWCVENRILNNFVFGAVCQIPRSTFDIWSVSLHKNSGFHLRMRFRGNFMILHLGIQFRDRAQAEKIHQALPPKRGSSTPTNLSKENAAMCLCLSLTIIWVWLLKRYTLTHESWHTKREPA